jgi:hypothetical protein
MSSDIDDDLVPARPAKRPRQVDILLLLLLCILLDTYINFDVFKYSLFFIVVRAWLVFLCNGIKISSSYNCHIIVYYISPIITKCYYYTLKVMIQPLKKGTGPSCWPRSLGTMSGGVRSPGPRQSLRTLVITNAPQNYWFRSFSVSLTTSQSILSINEMSLCMTSNDCVYDVKWQLRVCWHAFPCALAMQHCHTSPAKFPEYPQITMANPPMVSHALARLLQCEFGISVLCYFRVLALIVDTRALW